MSLFDKIPEKIFRPLAAANRRYYAALLLHLHENIFSVIGDLPRRADVLAEIGDFVERYTKENGELSPDQDELPQAKCRAAEREAGAGQDLRRYINFQYLVDSGWLVEMRDRFRKLVDLSPEGRLLLADLQKIVRGDSRSYGGAVLNVLGALDAACAHPDERSEAVRNAWLFSKDFAHHLRSMAAQVRRVETRILEQKDVRAVFGVFWNEFVAEMVIADFKTLRTKNNPFRFRHKILERVDAIESNALQMATLAEGYVREGRSPSVVAAEETIRTELREVYRLFDAIDSHLEIITEAQMRIECKIQTIVRYMDRHDGGSVDRAAQAIRALAATSAPLDAEVDVSPCLLMLSPLLGPDILHTPNQPRRKIDRARVHETPVDPAFEAFRQAKLAYAHRSSVSVGRMREFLERSLEGREVVAGGEVKIGNVDDFIVFQRLRDVPFMFDGILGKDYAVTASDGRANNDWLNFPEFSISRAPKGKVTP